MTKQVWFADRHHAALAYSLRAIAHDLGHEIYFPIGMEWFENGYWDIARPYDNNIATVEQYLSLERGYTPVDGTLPLNTIDAVKPTHYELLDLEHGDTLKAITFEQFDQMEIDVILASIPDHAVTYKRLRDTVKPGAYTVFEAGNMFDELPRLISANLITNFMGSIMPFEMPASVNKTFYHQRIPKPILRCERDKEKFSVYSFVHLLPQPELYEQYKQLLPNLNFVAYGALAPDGAVKGVQEVQKKMQEASMGYHNKPKGDGFGHVIHSWYMLGRPVLVNYADYKDKLAGQLMEPDSNCIALDSGEPASVIAEKVQAIADNPEIWATMSDRVGQAFSTVVDYERELETLRVFFDNLV